MNIDLPDLRWHPSYHGISKLLSLEMIELLEQRIGSTDGESTMIECIEVTSIILAVLTTSLMASRVDKIPPNAGRMARGLAERFFQMSVHPVILTTSGNPHAQDPSSSN